MATHKSAKKRNRQNIKRNARNRAQKSEITTLSKKIASASKKDTPDLLKALQSKLDKAGRKGLFHKKTTAKAVSKAMSAAASK